MEQTEWMEYLMERAKMDTQYQSCLEEVNRLEPAFLALRDSLSREQQQILDDYFSACEEMDHALLPLAMEAGQSNLQEEIYEILRFEGFYAGVHRQIQERKANPGKYRMPPERYREMCIQYNETVKRIMADTGEEFPLVDLDNL